MKFSVKDFFSKCDQISRKLWIWSHLLKKSLMENFIFLCSVNKAVVKVHKLHILTRFINLYLINSYFYSNFNYYSLVYMFSSAKSLRSSPCKKEPFVLYDHDDSSYESILQLAGKSIMDVT